MRLARLYLWTALTLPFSAIAQDELSDCIGTHFNAYHRLVSPHRSVSLAQIQQWSNWCKIGYTANQVAEASRPCYREQVQLIQQLAGGFLPITYEKSQQIKQYCRQQLWHSVNPQTLSLGPNYNKKHQSK